MLKLLDAAQQVVGIIILACCLYGVVLLMWRLAEYDSNLMAMCAVGLVSIIGCIVQGYQRAEQIQPYEESDRAD